MTAQFGDNLSRAIPHTLRLAARSLSLANVLFEMTSRAFNCAILQIFNSDRIDGYK